MREETDSNSFGEATDSHPSKKDAARRRTIRKDRTQPSDERGDCKLTKEERAKIQKEKNREAAQRSRDLHKEYVNSLENELRMLKQQLETSRQLCHRCQHPLQPQDFFTASPQARPDPHPHAALPDPHPHDPLEQESEMSYMRLDNLEDESSFLKMVLFICMVAIAALALLAQQPAAHPRTLLEVYQTPTSPLHEETTTPFKQQAGLVGLVQMTRGLDNEMCLDSLMRVQAPILRKGLRSIHSSYESREGILVCSYKTPKVYTLRAQLNNSPLVKIFLLGSQIKQMLTTSYPLRRLLDKNIQLNGIYQLSAQIKSADLVPHHNCLL